MVFKQKATVCTFKHKSICNGKFEVRPFLFLCCDAAEFNLKLSQNLKNSVQPDYLLNSLNDTIYSINAILKILNKNWINYNVLSTHLMRHAISYYRSLDYDGYIFITMRLIKQLAYTF